MTCWPSQSDHQHPDRKTKHPKNLWQTRTPPPWTAVCCSRTSETHASGLKCSHVAGNIIRSVQKVLNLQKKLGVTYFVYAETFPSLHSLEVLRHHHQQSSSSQWLCSKAVMFSVWKASSPSSTDQVSQKNVRHHCQCYNTVPLCFLISLYYTLSIML